MTVTARVYDPVNPDQPPRVLVDRLWPRGIRKDDQRVGTWLPEVAPSNGLRTWYHHHPDEFDQFATDYRQELAGSKPLEQLRALGPVTLVTAARDPGRSHLAVLAKVLTET
ncbi:MAG: DUF488 family protein [Mycobacterium sp.]|nr:DUF488 family protein [Mycobacterium sp.]